MIASIDYSKGGKKKQLYTKGLNWQTIYNQYTTVSDWDYIPETSRSKITSNQKQRRIL